ncbi:MAG: dihydroorotase [Chloroflexi bacterium]|nr:dihydroorotase [Chloroflexota bacterium]
MPETPFVGGRAEVFELDDAWLVDPATGREGRGGIRVEDGILVEVEWAADEPSSWSADDASEAGESDGRPAILVAPAFVDLHAHLRQPGREDAETIASGLAAAAHGGFGAICAMANTTPAIDTAGLVLDELQAAARTGSPVRLLPYGTITAGRKGDTLSHMGEMADAGAVGFSDDGSPVADASLFRNALAYAGSLGRMLVEHAEEPALVKGAEANEGLAATILGLKGWPAAAEESAVARDLALLAEVAASYPASAAPHLHLTHLSTAGSVELVRRAKAAGLPVTCDVTPHHLALHEGWVAGDRRFAWEVGDEPWTGGPAEALPFDQSTRVNPPLRTPADALALWAGLADGTVDAIATDHAPHTQVDKLVEFGDALAGISGIETAWSVVQTGVDAGLLPLGAAVRALTSGPGRVLAPALRAAHGPDGSAAGVTPLVAGLAEGAPANVVVIDTADGWEVTPETLRSKGKNSPLLGRRLRGRVLATIVDGRFAYADAEVAEPAG